MSSLNILTEIISNAQIKWEWKNKISAFGAEYLIGDFTASRMRIPELKLTEGPYTFCITENNFIDYHDAKYKEEEIFLVEPDNTWAIQYTEIETYLNSHFPYKILYLSSATPLSLFFNRISNWSQNFKVSSFILKLFQQEHL